MGGFDLNASKYKPPHGWTLVSNKFPIITLIIHVFLIHSFATGCPSQTLSWIYLIFMIMMTWIIQWIVMLQRHPSTPLMCYSAMCATVSTITWIALSFVIFSPIVTVSEGTTQTVSSTYGPVPWVCAAPEIDITQLSVVMIGFITVTVYILSIVFENRFFEHDVLYRPAKDDDDGF